ncbi:MAG TPA: ATP-binding cassette domain-containing protein [Gammaproteobacteria bacterium]|nr:ATP-binding cassette domain-containing protein [Gammaproteobacteria bacterium]
MIRVEGLSRSYGALKAVDGVSFEVPRGEVVGLLGHNAAGKTTIMKMITGYLEPSAGRIEVDGLDPARDRAAVQKCIGYLPENCPVYPDMTVVGYLEYQAGLHGLTGAERDQAVAAAVRRTALAEKALDPVHTLSRGYRQRVGVAQAILHDPDIVILDEPTNGLDPTQIRQMRSLIRELAEHATVIVSTHILQEVQAVCDRVLIIQDGRLAVDARLDELAGICPGTNGMPARQEAARRCGQLRLEADAAPETLRPLLEGLEGVTAVEPLESGEGHYRYRVEVADGERAPAVARAVTEAGHALFALAPQARDLETVFREVTETEVAHA